MIAKMYFDISHLRFEVENVDCVVHDGNINNRILFLSNNENIRKQYCFGKLSSEYGRSMHNYIPNSVFGYCDFSILDIEYSSTSSGIVSSEDFYKGYIREFNRRAAHLEALLTFLWFIKDNSAGLYGTYGQIPEAKIVNGKSRSIVNYTCTGEIVNTSFSEQELKEVGELVTKYSSICGLSRKIIDDTNMLWEYNEQGDYAKAVIPKMPESFSYKDQTAIDRAIHFLIIARGQNYLMYRIAYYMPIFECLFNSFGSEITYRIAQRAAYYIGENPIERKHIFDTISEGYDYRSKFIHGSGIEGENTLSKDKLEPLATNLDNYLRRILKKAITEDHEVFINLRTALKNTFFDNPILGMQVSLEELKAEEEKRKQQAKDLKDRAANKRQKGETQSKGITQ